MARLVGRERDGQPGVIDVSIASRWLIVRLLELRNLLRVEPPPTAFDLRWEHTSGLFAQPVSIELQTSLSERATNPAVRHRLFVGVWSGGGLRRIIHTVV